MKRKKYSPVVEVVKQPYSNILNQKVKLPNGSNMVVRYDEVSLLLQQNKMLRNLSPEDIRMLVENIGKFDSSSSLSDSDLSQIVTSRHLQEPCLLKAHIEAAFASYKEGKESLAAAVKSFKSGSYIQDPGNSFEDSKTD